MMKKARRVEISPEEPLPWEEYKKLRDHAYSSASFYLTQYGKHSAQVREKLYEKGYPRGPVEVASPKGMVERDMVEDALSRLQEAGLVEDELVVETLIERKLAGGSGLRKIEAELVKASIPPTSYKPILARYQEGEEVEAGLERAYHNVLTSYSYRKAATPFERRQRMQQALLRRGFSSADIAKVLEREE